MTRIGILSDPHLGFSRYSKVNDKGVNQREADFYRAFLDAVENLMAADVEAILDLGDLADNAHPKKRALHVLIDAINATGLPWYSVNGNHTLVRHSTDIHLYDILERYCKRFTGIRGPLFIESLDALLIPYGNSDEISGGLALADDLEPAFIGGHFACNDVLPDGHDIKKSDLPEDIPTLLGHFHGRMIEAGVTCKCVNDGWYAHDHSEFRVGSMFVHSPVYIGATERKAWGEATNPTGVAIYDTDKSQLQFIDHKTRDWLDLTADPTTYQDVLAEAMQGRDDQPIVRLTIAATKEEYRVIDEVALQRIGEGALDLLVRRLPTDVERAVADEPVEFSIASDWRSHVQGASIPRGVNRGAVEQTGIDALTSVGVAA